MAELARGGNTPLSGGPLEIAVAGARPGTVDLLVFPLGADGKVRREEDLVFFNQLRSPDGAVELVGGDRVRVDLDGLPADVATLAVAVALDDAVAHPLGRVAGLGASVADGAVTHSASAIGLGDERAALLVEVYRRGDGWKVRSVSAGWAEGLASLVTHFGVEVAADAPAPATARPAPGPAPAADAGPRTVPGEEKVSLEKRQALDLRKGAVHRVLLEKGAATQRARVVLVVDKTGSMPSSTRGRSSTASSSAWCRSPCSSTTTAPSRSTSTPAPTCGCPTSTWPTSTTGPTPTST